MGLYSDVGATCYIVLRFAGPLAPWDTCRYIANRRRLPPERLGLGYKLTAHGRYYPTTLLPLRCF